MNPIKVACLALLACFAINGCQAQPQYDPYQPQPGWNVDVRGPGYDVDVRVPQPNPYHPNVRPVQPYRPITPYQPQPNCPDGRCPLIRPNGQPAAQPMQPIQHPTQINGGGADLETASPDLSYLGSSVAIKQGSCKCIRCRRDTVGADWRNLWTDDGSVATYMCRECWDKTTPDQHAGYLRYVLQESKLPKPRHEPFIEALKSATATKDLQPTAIPAN